MAPYRPGYQGYGTNSIFAWAGGTPTLYRVTTLADSGVGSLRAAIEASGPRVVIFEVSGYITLDTDIALLDPYIVVAGQTAPSPGICVRGNQAAAYSAGGITIYSHDVLFQHFAIRPGDGGARIPQTYAHDALLLYSYNGSEPYNIVMDHMSLSWSGGKVFNIETYAYGSLSTVTAWRCIMAEALYYAANVIVASGQPSSLGTLVANFGSTTIRECLYAHCSDRNPETHQDADVQIVSSVFYGWGHDIYNDYRWATFFYTQGEPEPWTADVMSNAYIADAASHPFIPIYAVGTWNGGAGSRVFISDNHLDGAASADPLLLYINNMVFDPRVGSALLGTVADRPGSAAEAFALANAGTRPTDRNAIDTRIIFEVETRTGSVISSPADVGGYPAMAENTRVLTPPSVADQAAFRAWLEVYALEVETQPGTTITIGQNSTNTYGGMQDIYINSDEPTVNHSAAADVQVYNYLPGVNANALYRCTGLSNLPSNTTIINVTLNLYLTNADGGGIVDAIEFHRCLRAWIYGGGTWNTFDGTNNWGAPGGLNTTTDIASTVAMTADVINVPGVWYQWSGVQLAADFQGFVDGSLVNNGHLGYRSNGAGDRNYRTFVKSTGADGFRPYFTVSYVIPETGVVVPVLANHYRRRR